MLKFYVKVFYVMGKVLTGKLSCPYDRSCLLLDLVVKANKSENKKGFSMSEKARISSQVNKFYGHGRWGNSQFENENGRVAFHESLSIL